MKNILLIFILHFCINFCNAQQKIVFEQITPTFINKIKREYLLPKSVTCTFNNGTKQRLVLEKVKGDSLIFQKYYNQTQNFDCVFSSLKKIKVHRKGENFTYVLFSGFTIFGLALTAFAVENPDFVASGAADPSGFFYALIVYPIVLTTTGAIITSTSFPKKYYTDEWKLYVK